ncbi:MAG: lysylphosphatidylglycerol synthase domain-containing protein [Arenicella sp.]
MKALLRFGISVGISFGILGLMIHLFAGGLSPENRPSILGVLDKTIHWMLLVYGVLYLVQLGLRAQRYRILISAAGEQNVPNFFHMSLVTGVRNMFVDMLPARVGELSYVAMLNRGYRISADVCLSSLTVAIAFDFIALLVVVLGLFAKQLFIGGVEGWMLSALLSATVITLIALVGLFVIAPWFVRAFMDSSSPSIQKSKILNSIFELANKFSIAIQETRRSGRLISVLFLSVAIRVLKYAGFYLLFKAVVVPSFQVLASLPMPQVMSALIGGEIAASLPVPAFMSFGVYEAGGTAVLTAFGVDKLQSLVAMLSVHIWSQLFDYIFGGICLLVFVWLFRSARSGSGESDQVMNKMSQWLKVGLVGLVFLFGSALLAKEYRASKKMGATSAPPVGEDVTSRFLERSAKSTQELQGINGFAVWSSNRFGNHDIIKMDLPSREITRLTNNPHTEFYSRISPDGKKVVFARSHEPWVSQRNWVAWDVYILDIASGKEKLVSKNATFPSWVDNESVSYLHQGVQVVVKGLGLFGKTKVVYESGKTNKVAAGALISTPEYNPVTGQVVFTGKQSQLGMRKGFWGTAIQQTDNTHDGLYNGCQVFFSSDNSYMYQVTNGDGKYDPKGNRFMRIDPTTYESVPLFDFNDSYSHIYFPKDSNDGRYMVFGGSAGGHEHDTADYEIFLWDMSKSPDYATRLSFHSGNDNWPDVYINQ